MVSETLVANACRQLQITQAELARDYLHVKPQRLYEWRTMRRRIPAEVLDLLITLAAQDMAEKVAGLRAETVGHYTMEWQQRRELVKRRETRLAGAGSRKARSRTSVPAGRVRSL